MTRMMPFKYLPLTKKVRMVLMFAITGVGAVVALPGMAFGYGCWWLAQRVGGK